MIDFFHYIEDDIHDGCFLYHSLILQHQETTILEDGKLVIVNHVLNDLGCDSGEVTLP